MKQGKTIANFSLINANGIPRREDRITAGVPLTAGRVFDPNELLLIDSKDTKYESQVESLAKWDDGSAKWVLVTLPQISLEEGETRLFNLLREAKPMNPVLSVSETAKGWDVLSNRMRIEIPRTGPLISKLQIGRKNDWKTRVRDLDLSMSVEQGETICEYLASRGTRSVAVESSGPLRTVLCIRGVHYSEDLDRTFGPYTLRLEVVAHCNQIRFSHNFIFDGDPERDFVRSSELVCNLEVGDDREFGFGADNGKEESFLQQRADWAPEFRFAEIFQDSATHWRIHRWVDLERRAVFADAGTGLVRVGLYPRKAGRLDLQRYSDLIYPQTYEAPAFSSIDPIPFDKSLGAQGISKTHDVLFMLDEPNPSARTLCYNNPLQFQWSTEYFNSTGICQPSTASLDPAWLDKMNQWLDFLCDPLHQQGGTGYLDYFDFPHGFNVEEGRWFHDFGGWGYINDEAMPCLGLWQAWLLTGRMDVFALARAMTRHNMDIDSHHAGPKSGYGSRHNINHWGDRGKQRRVSQPVGNRFLYYLTGEKAVLDLAEKTRQSFVNHGDCFRKTNMYGDVPALVATLLLLEETGCGKFRKWLMTIADALADSIDEAGCLAASLSVNAVIEEVEPIPESGIVSFMMFSSFGGIETFAELAERYNHQALRAALVRLARHQMRPSKEREKIEGVDNTALSDYENTLRAADLLAYAHSITGDRAFIDHFQKYGQFLRLKIATRRRSLYGNLDKEDQAVPLLADWPDTPPDAKERWERYYPLFDQTRSAQGFYLAIYLHKMPGIMALAK